MNSLTKLIALFLFSTFVWTNGFAQKAPIKFGKFKPSEIKMTSYEKDTSAHAVIICDYGRSTFRYNQQEGNFQIMFDRHLRIKILDKEGYDWADFDIPLYHTEGSREKLSKFKAVAYNWENGSGKAIESKISKGDLFKEKKTKNWDTYKGTFPNVKEGTIIELKYSITSDFIFNLREWDFQHSIPAMWTEYNVSIPEFFYYNFTQKGYESLDVNEQESRNDAIVFTIKNRSSGGLTRGNQTTRMRNERVDYKIDLYRWAKADMPAFKEEAYMTTASNYITAMEFELATVRYPSSPTKSYTSTWQDINNLLVESSNFGMLLKKSNFIKDKVAELTAAATNDQEKAIAIHNFVKTQMKWDGYNSVFTSNNLKKAYNEKTGNAAEINLLLTLMLKEAGLNGKPVILSTRGHGIVSPAHPSISSFNYVVAAARIDDNYVLMDATSPYLSIGLLPKKCLNGNGKMITGAGLQEVRLMGTRKNKQAIQMELSMTEELNLTGKLKTLSKDYAALDMRRKVFSSSSQDNYEEEVEKEYNGLEILEKKIDNLDNIYKPIKTVYDIEIEGKVEEAGNLLYFNPMLYFGEDDNPFKLEKRSYPVDYAYPIDHLYSIKFQIPEGYEVDEVPEKAIVAMDGNAAKFTYHSTVNGDNISVTSILKINNTLFLPSDYENLKEFYNLIIKKHAEQIVLKKKS